MNPKVVKQWVEALSEEELIDETLNSLNSILSDLEGDDKVFAAGRALQTLYYTRELLVAYRIKKHGPKGITTI